MKKLIITLAVAVLVLATCGDDDDTCKCENKVHTDKPCDCGAKECDCVYDDNTDPVLCKCLETYGEYTHIEPGETCTCGGTDCNNCTTKVNTTSANGTIIIKEVGVSQEKFDRIVADLDEIWDAAIKSSGIWKEKYATITQIRVVKEDGINLQNGVLSIGEDEEGMSIYNYLMANVLALHPQPNHTKMATAQQSLIFKC